MKRAGACLLCKAPSGLREKNCNGSSAITDILQGAQRSNLSQDDVSWSTCNWMMLILYRSPVAEIKSVRISARLGHSCQADINLPWISHIVCQPLSWLICQTQVLIIGRWWSFEDIWFGYQHFSTPPEKKAGLQKDEFHWSLCCTIEYLLWYTVYVPYDVMMYSKRCNFLGSATCPAIVLPDVSIFLANDQQLSNRTSLCWWKVDKHNG